MTKFIKGTFKIQTNLGVKLVNADIFEMNNKKFAIHKSIGLPLYTLSEYFTGLKIVDLDYLKGNSKKLAIEYVDRLDDKINEALKEQEIINEQ